MFISFIIVSYNTKDRLKNCLQILQSELADKKTDYEVIVVDNASSDQTIEMLKSINQPYISNQINLGFAKACNQAAKQAQGEILFFLNSDIEFKRELFTYVVELFKVDQKLAIASPKLVGNDQIQEKFCCGKFPNLKRLLTRDIALGFNSLVDTLEVDWVSGAALAIRSSVFKELAGFDEKFFMYFEDADLCYRAKKLGYKTLLLNKISLLHYRGESLGDDSLRKKYYYQSQLHYFYKHFGFLRAVILWLCRLPLIFKSL
jgi:GT2 family glycosyltransferase